VLPIALAGFILPVLAGTLLGTRLLGARLLGTRLLGLRLPTMLLAALLVLVLLAGARSIPLGIRLARALFRVILLLLGHVYLSFHEWPRAVGGILYPCLI